MHSNDRPPDHYRYTVYRRPSWPWATVGVAMILAAGAYTGSDLSELARQRVGQHLLTASWFAIGAGGGLFLLIATAIFTEHIGIDDAAIEQSRLGRRDVRILWKDVERIVLHKGRKRPKGAIEVHGPQGRRIVAEPRLMRFDQLEAAILERAAFFGIEVRNYRG